MVPAVAVEGAAVAALEVEEVGTFSSIPTYPVYV